MDCPVLEIELNKNEYDYLYNLPFLQKKLQFLLHGQEGVFLLKISEQQADEIRDLCGEQLQLVGFDEKYKLTQEGKILESLIDKFFAG